MQIIGKVNDKLYFYKLQIQSGFNTFCHTEGQILKHTFTQRIAVRFDGGTISVMSSSLLKVNEVWL